MEKILLEKSISNGILLLHRNNFVVRSFLITLFCSVGNYVAKPFLFFIWKKLLFFSSHIPLCETFEVQCIHGLNWARSFSLPMATRGRLLPCPRKAVLQIVLGWNSAAVGESAAGTGLAQCVRNHHTPKSQCSQWGAASCSHIKHHSPSCAEVPLPAGDKGLAKPVHCPVLHCPLCFWVPGVQGEAFGDRITQSQNV